MAISPVYLQFECIRKLQPHYHETFKLLAEHYGTILNNGNRINRTLYTLHNFDQHCTNMYKLISTIILNPNSSYTTDDGLTHEELYILNLAVLFHDISMAVNIHNNRKVHSRESAEYLEHQYLNTDSVLHTRSQLCHNDITALKVIIKAHSDIKGEDVVSEINGINDPELQNDMPSRAGSIRSKLLAGILRLADELDITNTRIGISTYESQLSNEDPDEAESIKHWNNLHCVKDIRNVAERTSMFSIITNDEYIHQQFESGDMPNVVKNLVDVEKKNTG